MNLRLLPTALPDVVLVEIRRHADERGSFSELWNRRDFTAAGLSHDWVQVNEAVSHRAGTVRGLHYQIAPHAQAKLVRVARGRVLDVAVDLRRSSPTFGRHVVVELAAAEPRQLLIPEGFAHGYCTLEPDTAVLYRVTAHYAPDAERGVRWDDPTLAVEWPVQPDEAILSERDRELPLLAEQGDLFP